MKPADQEAELKRLRRRYEREQQARREAEAIADRVTGQLYTSLQELERLNAELASANQAIRDFVSVASHDLRGPLTSILGFVSTIRKRSAEIDETRKQEFLGIVESQARRLNRLVEDLLTVSKIEAGAVEARIQEIYLGRALVENVRGLGEGSDEILVASGPPELRVLADPDHLHRILQNYLTNALKYGAPPIEAACTEVGDWAEIRVCDSGEGVPEEFIPRLFEKFARAEGRAAVAKEGTGLGLSIVRGLARANGGDAWYEPNRPHGSCFAVRLPKAS